MTQSIFYSWQSDAPKKSNRYFIEDALKKAIKEINDDVEMQEAMLGEELSLDKDTKGLAGTPPITEAILSKIAESTVFVPDLTFVGKGEKDRLLSNPNVLIEYGYAISEITLNRMVPVMNTAFGKPDGENLPFNIRHLRHPIKYSLNEDATPAEKTKSKKDLVNSLVEAIKLILIKYPRLKNADSSPEPFHGTPCTTKPSIFFNLEEAFLEPHKHGDVNDRFPNNQHLFLHLIPNEPVTNITSPNKAGQLIREGLLIPMGGSGVDYTYGRNEWGAYSVLFDNDQIEKCTELLLTGEIWGIDAHTIDRSRLKAEFGTEFGFFQWRTIKKIYLETLRKYLSFARDTVELKLPLRIRAGMIDVRGYKMATNIRSGAYRGAAQYVGRSVVVPEILYEGVIPDYSKKAEELLEPLFNKLWEECDLNRSEYDSPINITWI